NGDSIESAFFMVPKDTGHHSLPRFVCLVRFKVLASDVSKRMLPLSLLNLPNLSTLSLDNNQVFGPLPNHVSGLLNLNVLSLRSNFLNGTLPSWLFNLPSLVRLNLGDNQFIGEIGEFKSNSLEYLHLEYNKLHGSIPRSLLNLPNLSTLYLRNNQLVGPLPVHISSLNLVELDLSSNFLNGTLPSWLFNHEVFNQGRFWMCRNLTSTAKKKLTPNLTQISKPSRKRSTPLAPSMWQD
ncbi:receptor-like protein cf-9 like protein, partial [Quercus suber]